MSEDGMTPQCLDHRNHPVVTSNPEVVPLGDIVREYHPAALAETTESGEQHRSFEVLGLIDDDEAFGEASTADMSERQDLEQPTVDDFVNDLWAGDGFESIGHGCHPRTHLLELRTGEIPEILATHRVQRPEDKNACMRALFEHRLEAGGEGEHALAGAGGAPERNDADA